MVIRLGALAKAVVDRIPSLPEGVFGERHFGDLEPGTGGADGDIGRTS